MTLEKLLKNTSKGVLICLEALTPGSMIYSERKFYQKHPELSSSRDYLGAAIIDIVKIGVYTAVITKFYQ